MTTQTEIETYISLIKGDNMTTASIIETLNDLKTPTELVTTDHNEVLIHVPDGAHFGYSLNTLREAVAPATVRMFTRYFKTDNGFKAEYRCYSHPGA